MKYGDEHYLNVPPGFDAESLSSAELEELFENAPCISRFKSTPKNHFIHDRSQSISHGLVCYKLKKDCLIEVNDLTPKTPSIFRNQVSDMISFQFVSRVRRAEFLGEHRHVHNFDHAMIVTVFPEKTTTYRLPKGNVPIRHVAIYTTLSNLLKRMREPREAYPEWFLKSLDGEHQKPQQRIFFLEEIHRDLISYCFHAPVSGDLVGHWMAAKFQELLCLGLQLLKSSQSVTTQRAPDRTLPSSEKIARAHSILNREYVNPPSLPVLAKHLGISQTQLKVGFKSQYDTTVMQFCIAMRINAAKLLLRENRHSISEIADIIGYEDHSAFCRAFRRINGCTPQEWRRSSLI